jgi:hypothetical protein
MNNISTTQIKINSCRTTQTRQPNNKSKHWSTIVRNKRKIWGFTYSGSYKNKEMEPSVKKSASGRASALPKNLIRWHWCKSSDRQCRLEDTALPRSAAWQTKEWQSRKWRRKKWVWTSRTSESLEYRTSPIYRGLLWNCPDLICLNSRNRPWNLSTFNLSEPTHGNAPTPPITPSWCGSLGVVELTN